MAKRVSIQPRADMSNGALLKKVEERQFDGRRDGLWDMKVDHLVCLHKYGNFYRTRSPFVLRAGKRYYPRLLRILERRHEGFKIEITYIRRPEDKTTDFEFGYRMINKYDESDWEQAHGDLKEIHYK